MLKEVAQRIHNNEKAVLIPSQTGWSVEGLDGKLHSVRLFGPNGAPRQYCTCAATATCFHIMAAMMSIGYQPKPSVNRKANGTIMRQNLEKTVNFQSGKKKPRLVDTDHGKAKMAARRKNTEV